MSRDNDLRDWSRQTLEAAADHLAKAIAAGDYSLLPRLKAVRAAIPDAADYHIDHGYRRS